MVEPLDPLDDEIDTEPSPYQKFLLKGRIADQQRVVLSLVDSGMNGRGSDPLAAIKLAKRIACCCRGSAAAITSTGALRVVEFRCKSKLCPICAKRRAAAVFAKVGAAIRKMDAPRFMTLGLASTDAPLREQLLRLRKCFAELRRAVPWKDRVTGGVYTLEITKNPKTKLWHPHLHLIIDGKFFPQSLLSDLWHRVTTDSYIVDIRKVNSAKQAATYIAKYVSKSLEVESLTDDELVEWIEQVRSIRFVQTFGSLHGVNLDEREPNDTPYVEPDRIGVIEGLAHHARRGNAEARELLAYLSSVRHRRISNGEPGQPLEPPAGEREIVDRLRTWFRNEEKARSDHFAQIALDAEIARSRDWLIR